MQDYFDIESIEKEYDLVVVGGGPAGCVAALYASRDALKILVLEKLSPGGTMALTAEVDNHPGYPETVTGMELSEKYHIHAKKYGAHFKNAECTLVEDAGDIKLVHIKGRAEPVKTKTVIIATGSTPRKLGIPGEEKFWGRGVSGCATCDGGFYKDKNVVVVGGGSTALEESDYLTRFVSKVYLVHRRKEFRGDLVLQKLVKSNPKIELVLDTVLTEIKGDTKLNGVLLKNVLTGEEKELAVEGVFIFIGQNPYNEPIKNLLTLNEEGFVVADETTATNIEAIYAAGDIRAKQFRQIATAVSDGAVAAKMAVKHIQEMNIKE